MSAGRHLVPQRRNSRVRTQRSARLGGVELPIDSALLDQVAGAANDEYLAERARLAPLPPAGHRSGLTEAAWQAQVVRVAKTLGFYVYHPKLSRWSERGWPDLSLLGRRALWIECKTDAGLLTEAQVAVIGRMLACDLEVYVLRPWHGLQAAADILTGSDRTVGRCLPAP